MPSATLQALTLAPTMVPPPNLSTPAAAESWFNSLPSATQDRLKARISAIVTGLPPVVQLELGRYLAQMGATSPVPMANGLGTTAGFDWGGLIMGLATAGAGVITAAQTARTQQSIAANQASSNAAIQQALVNAQIEANNAIIAAQRDYAIAADVGKTQRAPLVALGVVGIAVVGVAGFLYARRKR